MSLKSFDDFCAKIVNNDPIVSQKDIFDERQTVVRSQITTRALWAFVIMSGISLLWSADRSGARAGCFQREYLVQ